ncbi:type II toxin-antitoxin system VapC family toxin [candidate division KSB1 bacterium]|nr:type II toxin-antitoxin system VapC family toxin [candidate division KSB1 bacterium]
MILVDTNIFLEILLKQKKSDICKTCLDSNAASLFISDFSLHSIGLILLKCKAIDVLRKFLNDSFPAIRILTLPTNAYESLIDAAQMFTLDFDDAYQHAIAKNFNLKIATMDQDFKRVDDVEILFL